MTSLDQYNKKRHNFYRAKIQIEPTPSPAMQLENMTGTTGLIL